MRIIALLVGLTISFTITQAMAEKLTIERLVGSPSLHGPKVDAVKISPDGSRVTFLRGKDENYEQQDLWEYNLADNQLRLLVDSAILQPGGEKLSEVEKARRERMRIRARGIVQYFWSPDGKALLIPSGGDLYYLELGGPLRRLTETEAYETDPKISPRGRYVSFIRDQNLYVADLQTGDERAVTTEGGGVISLGMAEFVAQEEMFRTTGYWWAPDEDAIVVARVDDSPVAVVNRYDIAAEGVTTIAQRYPYAGTKNAIVELYVIDLDSGEGTKIDLGDNDDIYLARVNWRPDGSEVFVQRESRDQKRLDLLAADPKTGKTRTVLTERADDWVNLSDDLIFLGGGDRFLWSSERTGYRHIYLYNADGSLIHAVTQGDWPISESGRRGGAIKAVDSMTGQLWFEGFRDNPLERHLYRVSFEEPEAPVRLTEAGSYHGTSVARDGAFFVDDASAPRMPPRVSVRSAAGELLAHIVENPLDESHPYAPYLDAHIDRQFGKIQAADGTDLYYQITAPKGASADDPLPAILFVYGGPHSQQVAHRWELDFDQILAQSGYVVFTLDNRGAASRGHVFEAPLYRAMGGVEVEDQVTGINYLKSLDFVDSNRIGVWGHSYGGYMTLMLLTKAGDYFRAGVARAPVTDWGLYDTHYTERYLGRPDEPGDVYQNSSVFAHLDGLQSRLLLVHGMADDNVVFSNSVRLMNELQNRGVQFDLMTYPGKRHGISGEKTQAHLMHLMLDFFDRNVKNAPARRAATTD